MEAVLKYFSDFSSDQLRQFEALSSLYMEWNQQINVISRKDVEGLYEKHVLHSLSIAAVYDLPEGIEVLDLGTGGGFPGVPLAIFFPHVKFHLVDSIGKKLKVVNAIAEKLGLSNITTQHTRAEEISNRKFDMVVSRAVAPLKELWRWSRPLLKSRLSVSPAGGKELYPGLICLKGGDLAQEIHESGTRPGMVHIHDLFPEEFFNEKYLLYISRSTT